MKKPKTKEPSLRDKLSQLFDEALLANFAAKGASVIEQMCKDDPTRYAELVGKRIMAADPKPDGFESCDSVEELGRKLLKSVGLDNEEAITPDMIQAAIAAQDEFVAQLARIAGGN